MSAPPSFVFAHTLAQVRQMTDDELDDLDLTVDKIDEYRQKLREYIYVDSYKDLVEGRYVRWMFRDDENPRLHAGGFFAETRIVDDATNVVCRNVNAGRTYYTIPFNDAVVFMKLNKTEIMLLKSIGREEK